MTHQELKVFLKENNLLQPQFDDDEHPSERYWPGD